MHGPGRPLVSSADIEAMTTWTLIRLGHHLERLLTDALDGTGLTPLQYGVLAHLSARPALTQTELAAAVLVRPQSMQHHLDRLEGMGLLERAARRGRGQPNPITLTERGAAALRSAERRIDHANAADTLGLTMQQAGELSETAHRLLALDTLRRSSGPHADSGDRDA